VSAKVQKLRKTKNSVFSVKSSGVTCGVDIAKRCRTREIEKPKREEQRR